MNRPNSEIDNLLNSRLHLIEQAARSLCAARWDELTWEIIPLWYRRYLANPQKYWDMLANPNDYEVVADMKFIGLRVLDWWKRCERDESLELVTDCQTIEWGKSDKKTRYLDGIGDYAGGDYLATDDDLKRLFDMVARKSMVDEDGNGLGRVEAADLMGAYRAAKPKVQQAIRKLASGYGASELTDRRKTFMAVAGVLQSAL